MEISGVLESCLYAVNLRETARFYREVLGLDEISRESDRHVFFRCGGGMLLIFNPDHTGRTQTSVNGAPIPLHGCQGVGHLAFSVSEQELPDWRKHLQDAGVEIESEVNWPGGGTSMYVRDPAGNSIEFTNPEIWGLQAEG